MADTVRYVWLKESYFGPALAICDFKVFTREPSPPIAYASAYLDGSNYLALDKAWNFWPATVAMWFTIPANSPPSTGGSFKLLGTRTTSSSARGYNIEVLLNGNIKILWDHSRSFVVDVDVRTGPECCAARWRERFEFSMLDVTSWVGLGVDAIERTRTLGRF